MTRTDAKARTSRETHTRTRTHTDKQVEAVTTETNKSKAEQRYTCAEGFKGTEARADKGQSSCRERYLRQER